MWDGGVDLETEHSQSQMGFSAHQPKRFCDIGTPEISEEADREIPEGSHDSWSIAGSYLRAVFIKRDIPDPMKAVLNTPVGSVEMKKTAGVCLLRGEAGDPLDDFYCRLVFFDVSDFTAESEDLSHIGEVEIIIELGAGPDLADFKAAMCLIDGLVLRGGKRPGSMPRYLI